VAKNNPHIDYWFWGQEGITCGKTESQSDCFNRQDWNTMEKTVEAITNDQPTLTVIDFGEDKNCIPVFKCDYRSVIETHEVAQLCASSLHCS
jgi:hypothetical protein